MKRIVFDILLFVCVFTLPWWITGVLAFLGIFLFVQFYEFIIVWSIMYSVFAIPSEQLITSPVWFSLSIGLVYVGIQYLRDNMIVYKNN